MPQSEGDDNGKFLGSPHGLPLIWIESIKSGPPLGSPLDCNERRWNSSPHGSPFDYDKQQRIGSPNGWPFLSLAFIPFFCYSLHAEGFHQVSHSNSDNDSRGGEHLYQVNMERNHCRTLKAQTSTEMGEFTKSTRSTIPSRYQTTTELSESIFQFSFLLVLNSGEC